MRSDALSWVTTIACPSARPVKHKTRLIKLVHTVNRITGSWQYAVHSLTLTARCPNIQLGSSPLPAGDRQSLLDGAPIGGGGYHWVAVGDHHHPQALVPTQHGFVTQPHGHKHLLTHRHGETVRAVRVVRVGKVLIGFQVGEFPDLLPIYPESPVSYLCWPWHIVAYPGTGDDVICFFFWSHTQVYKAIKDSLTTPPSKYFEIVPFFSFLLCVVVKNNVMCLIHSMYKLSKNISVVWEKGFKFISDGKKDKQMALFLRSIISSPHKWSQPYYIIFKPPTVSVDGGVLWLGKGESDGAGVLLLEGVLGEHLLTEVWGPWNRVVHRIYIRRNQLRCHPYHTTKNPSFNNIGITWINMYL